MDVDARRAELLGWIEKTKRLQRKMAFVYAGLAVVAIVLVVLLPTAGVFSLISLVLVAIMSFWITAAHNAAHRQKLDELAQVARNHGKPLQTAHRRWQR